MIMTTLETATKVGQLFADFYQKEYALMHHQGAEYMVIEIKDAAHRVSLRKTDGFIDILMPNLMFARRPKR